jgi:hypothetical protein
MSSCTENIQGALCRTRNFHLHPKQKEQKEAKTFKRKRIGIDALKGRNKKEKVYFPHTIAWTVWFAFPMLGSRWWLLCVGMTDRQRMHNVTLWRIAKHCCNGNATMHSVGFFLELLFENAECCKQCCCNKVMSPATMKLRLSSCQVPDTAMLVAFF